MRGARHIFADMIIDKCGDKRVEVRLSDDVEGFSRKPDSDFGLARMYFDLQKHRRQ
jgi:hypothetical protein